MRRAPPRPRFVARGTRSPPISRGAQGRRRYPRGAWRRYLQGCLGSTERPHECCGRVAPVDAMVVSAVASRAAAQGHDRAAQWEGCVLAARRRRNGEKSAATVAVQMGPSTDKAMRAGPEQEELRPAPVHPVRPLQRRHLAGGPATCSHRQPEAFPYSGARSGASSRDPPGISSGRSPDLTPAPSVDDAGGARPRRLSPANGFQPSWADTPPASSSRQQTVTNEKATAGMQSGARIHDQAIATKHLLTSHLHAGQGLRDFLRLGLEKFRQDIEATHRGTCQYGNHHQEPEKTGHRMSCTLCR